MRALPDPTRDLSISALPSPAAAVGPRGTIDVPNNPLIATALEAIWHGGIHSRKQARGWTEQDLGPMFSRTGRHGGKISVYVDPEAAPRSPGGRDSRWSLVDSISAFTGDVLLAVVAAFVAPCWGDGVRRPVRDFVVVESDTLLKYKGIADPKDPSHVARVSQEIEWLSALRFDVERYPLWEGVGDGRRRRRVTWRGDRLFEAVRLERADAGGGLPRRATWRVRLGQWARRWFDESGRRYVSTLPGLLLALDHRPTRAKSLLSKKIGEKILLLHDISRSSKPLEFTVAQLLSMTGELPLPEYRGKQWAGRVRDRFDEAILALEHSGVFASVIWPDGFGPGDPDRYRGWVDRWLAARVLVSVKPVSGPDGSHAGSPARTPVRTLDKKRSARTVPAPDCEAYDFRNLRAVRTDRGWTQRTLAERLGISPSLLSRIENGHTVPSGLLVQKLVTWLSSG